MNERTLSPRDRRDEQEPPATRQEEWRSFLFFTVVMAPAIAVAIVVSYGFLIWIYQMLAGPPTA